MTKPEKKKTEYNEMVYTRRGFNCPKCKEVVKKEDVPDAWPGPTDWHGWVYGGQKNPNH